MPLPVKQQEFESKIKHFFRTVKFVMFTDDLLVSASKSDFCKTIALEVLLIQIALSHSVVLLFIFLISVPLLLWPCICTAGSH